MIKAAVILLATTGPGVALELAMCERITHPTHGGESDHMDHGTGWVSWTDWWSLEGVFADLHVADCTAQRVVVSRLHEERIKGRTLDRREAGAEAFERHLRRSPALYSLDDLAEALTEAGGETTTGALMTEVCACAAAYPDTRGDLAPFALN